MNRDLFDRIVDALLPDMDDLTVRKILVESVLLARPSCTNSVGWRSGSVFTARLTRQLDEYGDIINGKPALVALLEELRGEVGEDRQQQIDELIAAFQAPPVARPFSSAHREDRRRDVRLHLICPPAKGCS